MNDREKTKDLLIKELNELRVKNSELEIICSYNHTLPGETLRESEKKYTALFESIPDTVYLIDQETGQILDVNAAATRTYGYSHDEFIKLKNTDVSAEPHETQMATQDIKPNIPIRYHKRKDGSVFPVEISASTFDLHGKKVIIGTARDITGRVLADKAIHDSEEKYRALFNNEIYAICIFDLKTLNIIDANKSFTRLYGYTREELISGMTVNDITAEEQSTAETITTAELKGNLYIPLRYHRKKNGNIFPVEVVGGLYEWKGRKVMSGITRDITDRVQVENTLRESDERFHNAIDASIESFFMFKSEKDQTGKICDFVFVEMNTRAEKMLHMNRGQLLGKRMCEELPINRTNGFFEKYKLVAETGIPLEEEFYLPETHVPAAWYYHQVVRVGDDKIAISHRDISERKQIEDALKKSNEYNEAILSALPDLLFVVDHDGIILDYRAPDPKLLYARPEEFLRKNIHDVLPPEASRIISEAIRRASNEGIFKGASFSLPLPEGELWFELSIAAVSGAVHFNNRLIVMVRNITERKQAEEKLKQSEARLVAAQAVAKVGSWETNLLNFTVFWSDETYRIFEIDRNNFKTTHPNFLEYVHPDDVVKVNLEFIGSFDSSLPHSIEHRIITPGGSLKFLEERWRIIHDAKGRPLRAEGTCQDITERKQAEEALNKKNEELQKALDEVNTLQGFLPICANCKKIRDDQGYWNQIEAYISEHSNIQFTHGICPDCTKKFYPELELDEDDHA